MLANDAAQDGATVQADYAALLTEMRTRRDDARELAPAIDHFLKVTDSYAPGLFHCYTVEGLPPTDNDLEHVFGIARHHERRTTGRKVASAALVVRGAVRVVAAVASWRPSRRGGRRVVAAVASQQRARPFGEADLRPHGPPDLARWRTLRAQLACHHAARRAQRRFRRDPDGYLTALEAQLLQSSLPV